LAASDPVVERVGILQLTDSLQLGGAERVAVNFANALPRERFEVHLASTREEGPLAAELADDVGRLALGRTRRSDDLRAAFTLARYVKRHDIRLLHCHKETFFLAVLAGLVGPRRAILWHDHSGRRGVVEDLPLPPSWVYRLFRPRVDGVVAVSESARACCVDAYGFARERAWYLANFVEEPATPEELPDLPGARGARILCIARIHPDKGLLTLTRAMARVAERVPAARVLILGVESDPEYGRALRAEIARLGVEEQVLLMGPRSDVPAVIRACDVGVLSSDAEGLPLALLEYGMGGIPTVSTDVGQCREVLAGGDAGVVVPPGDSEALADGLVRLLGSPGERSRLAALAGRYARDHHGRDAVVGQIVEIYDQLLQARSLTSRVSA
jgi:glycosyltransferase involved in cell wall biosynthesis